MSDSLIPAAAPASETTTETTTETTPGTQTESTPTTPTTETTPTGNEEVSFLLAEGIGGKGETPEWFKGDKYKNVSEQAKAYTELEGKFGSFTGSPKDGKYEIEGVDFADNPLMSAVSAWGAKSQLSNQGMSDLFTQIDALAKEQIETERTESMKALGNDAEKRLGDLASWGQNNLEPEQFKAFQALAGTAAQVEMLEILIGKTKNSKLVDTKDTTVNPGLTEAAIKAMRFATNEKGQRLMDVDPAHRAKVTAASKEFYKD